MKNFLATIIILTLATISQLNAISAHELETNQTVGAVLHMSPEDDPIVGEQTGFYFEFKDKENEFSPEKCNCTFSIEEAGKEIYSQDLFQNNKSPTLDNASAFFVFPKKAIYKIKLVGEPVEKGAFNRFNIEYEVNVQRDASTPTPTPVPQSSEPNSINKNSIYFAGIIIFVVVASAILLKKRK